MHAVEEIEVSGDVIKHFEEHAIGAGNVRRATWKSLQQEVKTSI